MFYAVGPVFLVLRLQVESVQALFVDVPILSLSYEIHREPVAPKDHMKIVHDN